MRYILLAACIVLVMGCGGKKVIQVNYPEKLEGLTQLVLASETRNIVSTDTTILQVLNMKISSSQVKITSNVTYDFYLDFEQDGYKLKFSSAGDTVTCDAPPIRVKKPVINSTSVSYPEKGIFIDEKAKAVEKLEKLTDRYVGEGEEMLKQQYIIDKCREMLSVYLLDLCKKMNYPVKTVIIIFREIAA
jgi:hypothetical protein